MRYEQLRSEAGSACPAPPAPAASSSLEARPWERRAALRNAGRLDLLDIDAYIAHCEGYSGLAHALEAGPESVLAALEQTGLRGRGGAGYPTARKWQVCRGAEGDEKYAVCNAVDSDPWSRTARLLMGTDPHSVLEGLVIGAYTVGAAQCLVCINAEYGDEIAVVRRALEQMRERGLSGGDILGSGYSCDITVVEIPGSPVAGEETALLRAVVGRQPLPYLRFDYPAVKGLHDKPTLVNSAETLANVSAIFSDRGDSATGTGAGEPTGTKVVTICGDVSDPRTVEIPLGMTLGALIEAVEGAPLSGLDIKAVQFGGPTGAFFAGATLDTPIDYEALEAAGSVMGSASLRVFGGRHACAVEIARDAMMALQEQSCGKCTACREGTYQLSEMLSDLVDFRAQPEDMELMLELCEAMQSGSICGFGKTSSAPLSSSLALFGDDFEAHLNDKRCPAKE